MAIAGEIAISASIDNTLRLWNWKTGVCLAIYRTDCPQYAVAIGDGVVVSGGQDGQVHFFGVNQALRGLLGW